jgi:hypothetical protein
MKALGLAPQGGGLADAGTAFGRDHHTAAARIRTGNQVDEAGLLQGAQIARHRRAVGVQLLGQGRDRGRSFRRIARLHQQAELRAAQAAGRQRVVIELRDLARQAAHHEAGADRVGCAGR